MKKTKNNLIGLNRFRFIGVIALTTIIAMGIVAAVSAQIGTVNKDTAPRKGDSAVNQQNPPLSAKEAQKLADGVKKLVNQSDEGLVEVRHPDGTVTTDLQGRFQNIAVAKTNDDGTVSQSCIDNTESASAFFGIDPKRFGNKPKAGAKVKPSETDANGLEIK